MSPAIGQSRPYGIPIQLILFVVVGVLGQLFLPIQHDRRLLHPALLR